MIKELEKEIKKNTKINQIIKKINLNTAKQEDVSLYAAELGQCVANIITKNVNENIEWEELNNMALPLFMEVYRKVMDAATSVQKVEDAEMNIGLNPVIPEFPKDKIHDLIYKIYKYLKEGTDNED